MKNHKDISASQTVKAYVYGDTVELTMTNISHQQSILILPNHRYVVLSTGEIKTMNVSVGGRSDNIASVKRTMRNLRRLITANFSGGDDQLWVTLTYSKNINAHNSDDTKIVYRDFKIMMQRLRKEIGPLEYVAILEPQASGRWHMHVLLKTKDGSTLYIPNHRMQKIWGRGFTKVKRLSNKDNIASYVMAYVSNLRISDGTMKKNVKGARLYLYPKNVRIYRCSRGIQKPIVKTTTKKQLAKEYDLEPEYKRASYCRTFLTKNGTKITTETEFFERKEK